MNNDFQHFTQMCFMTAGDRQSPRPRTSIDLTSYPTSPLFFSTSLNLSKSLIPSSYQCYLRLDGFHHSSPDKTLCNMPINAAKRKRGEDKPAKPAKAAKARTEPDRKILVAVDL